uniref:non-specific serine/threonine protein kinase n=1 Tax=Timema bartmani TaxID=61472 RepID=A0A7R9F4B9_9NEOP|nr:unnamed protein product [Timema bartmani]
MAQSFNDSGQYLGEALSQESPAHSQGQRRVQILAENELGVNDGSLKYVFTTSEHFVFILQDPDQLLRNIAHSPQTLCCLILDFRTRSTVQHVQQGLRDQVERATNKESEKLIFNALVRDRTPHYPRTRLDELDNTVVYTDPQILKGDKPSTMSDVYSFGITLWQLLARVIPHNGNHLHIVIYQVVAKHMRPTTYSSLRETMSDYVALYEQCWQQDPHQRPCINVILRTSGNLYNE